MKKNMGVMDKIIRLSVVLIICALYLVDAIQGFAAIALGAGALYLTATSFISVCPFYLPFGHDTLEENKTAKSKGR